MYPVFLAWFCLFKTYLRIVDKQKMILKFCLTDILIIKITENFGANKVKIR